ncbi:MAG: transcription termination/antitermination protein NusA [Candidatus Parcubacteria bacterium]|nr:MAG: transcription termination/antitermination protein NusA [Candidatus Parcubacteria bacterium]
MINIKQFQNFIDEISEEKDLSEDDVKEAILTALAAAYKKDYCNKEEKVESKLDPTGRWVEFYLVKTVIDDNPPQFNNYKNIKISEAIKINPSIKVGDEIRIPLEIKENFSRVATQTAKQVIIQKLREINKEKTYEEFKNKEGKIVSGAIQKVDPNIIYVDLGKTIGYMFKNETIPGEFYRIGNRMRFYVYAVEKTSKGVEIYLSRSHPLFLNSLFTFEISEISEGQIEIKNVVRLPGIRSKIAVKSKVNNLDPVGTCIGPKGARVLNISNELNGEKIDIILYSDDPVQYVINALSPAKIISSEILPQRTIKVYVSEDQLPIVLGRNGINIKLASKLTGWKIDVRLIEEPEREIEGGVVDAESDENIKTFDDDNKIEDNKLENLNERGQN